MEINQIRTCSTRKSELKAVGVTDRAGVSKNAHRNNNFWPYWGQRKALLGWPVLLGRTLRRASHAGSESARMRGCARKESRGDRGDHPRMQRRQQRQHLPARLTEDSAVHLHRGELKQAVAPTVTWTAARLRRSSPRGDLFGDLSTTSQKIK